MNHTPTTTPWHIGALSDTELRDAQSNCLGHVFTAKDAEFIVKCCNEHDALNAVAEAAQRVADNPVNKYLVQLDDALADLSTIRKGAQQ